jgi:uncharacterized protein (TIGR03435 family)
MPHRPAIRLVCALVVASLTSAAVAARQTPSVGAVEFDVASVRPAVPRPTFGPMETLLPKPVRVLHGDRFEAPDTALASTVAFAYGLEGQFDRIKGGGPILNEFFTVFARGTPGSFAAPAHDGLQPVRYMVQHLLAERFGLVTRIEQEDRRVLLLTRASATAVGPALRPLPNGCARFPTFPEDVPPEGSGIPRCTWLPDNGTLTATGTFREFARSMSGSMQQEIVDETGLEGAYLFSIAFDPDTFLRPPPEIARLMPIGRHSDLPAFRTVLKSDLGLVLVEATRPVPVLVITHIEPLREN